MPETNGAIACVPAVCCEMIEVIGSNRQVLGPAPAASEGCVKSERDSSGDTAACQSHLTRHTPHVTRHTSHVTRHTSHVTRHTSHVTRHTSHVTRHTSHVTRHTSHVTRHTSHCHTSHVTRQGAMVRSCRRLQAPLPVSTSSLRSLVRLPRMLQGVGWGGGGDETICAANKREGSESRGSVTAWGVWLLGQATC